MIVPRKPFKLSLTLASKALPNRMKHLSGAPLWVRLLALPTHIRLGWDKHSSLLQAIGNYVRSKFYSIWPLKEYCACRYKLGKVSWPGWKAEWQNGREAERHIGTQAGGQRGMYGHCGGVGKWVS